MLFTERREAMPKNIQDVCEEKARAGDGSFAIAYALLEVAKIAEAIQNYRTDHPLMGETFDGISSGLYAVAEAIEGVEFDNSSEKT